MKRLKRLLMLAMVVQAVFATGGAVADEIVLAQDVEVTVPDGETQVCARLGGSGAYTLTKKGGGTLVIQCVENTDAKIVIAAGEVRLTNPRPDEIFAKAYFHVDAADRSTMAIESVNGTNFVTRWNDADGRSERYATHCTTVWNCRTDPENRKPYLTAAGQNGLPVMNFGSLLTKVNVDAEGRALGYGAAMTFDHVTPAIAEHFTVAADSDDIQKLPEATEFDCTAMNAMSFFSHETSYRCVRRTFYAPDYAKGGPGLLADNAQNAAWTGGSIWFDGNLVTGHPKWVYPKPGFHIVHMRPDLEKGTATFNSFGAEYIGSTSRCYGGMKIAEYALFTNALETAESDAVHRYLRQKWYPIVLAAVDVRSGARFSAADGLAVQIVDFSADEDDMDLSVSTSQTLDSLKVPNAVAHFDASDESSLVLDEVNGTNFVSRWNDTQGGPYAATNDPTVTAFRPDPENRRAFLSSVCSPTGLPAVDFGSALFLSDADGTEGYGAAMWFGPAKTLSMAEGFTIACDNEGLKDNRANKAAGPSFFANRDGEMHGRRGVTEQGKNPPLYTYFSSNTGSLLCKDGTSYLDGEPAAYTVNYPDGYHLLNTIPTAKMYCNALARNYRSTGATCNTFGGLRIGEFIVLGEVLADATRQRVTTALLAKWLGAARGTRRYRNLELGPAAVFSVIHEKVAVTGTLRLGGRLVAQHGVTATTLALTSPAAEIDGALALGPSPVLDFSQIDDSASLTALSVPSLALGSQGGIVRIAVSNAKALSGGRFRIVDCPSVAGSLDGWTVEVMGESNLTARLEADREGLSVGFARSGLLLIYR